MNIEEFCKMKYKEQMEELTKKYDDILKSITPTMLKDEVLLMNFIMGSFFNSFIGQSPLAPLAHLTYVVIRLKKAEEKIKQLEQQTTITE